MLFTFLVTLFAAPLYLLYWIKWALAYAAIRLYSAFQDKRLNAYDITALGDPIKLGFLVPPLEKELESPFPDSHLQEAADEVAFYGVNSKSECLLVRLARGCNHKADAWIYLKLANGKTYNLAETTGRWRIFYCGMLKEVSENKKDAAETVFVKFVFLWTSSSDIYDCTFDTNPCGFATAMARSEWRVPFVPPTQKLKDALNYYAQTGIINGTVSINDGSDYEMYLFGKKFRSLGKSASIAGCKFTSILGNVPSTGFSFQLSSISVPYAFKSLPFGFIVDGNGTLSPLKNLDINMKPSSTENLRSSFKANFFCSGQGWSGFLEMSFVEYKVNNRKGFGLIMSGEVYNETKSLPAKSEPSITFPE
ncbi:putative phosphoenolpyruvate synthase, partial [Caerostris extrusa]